MPMMDEAGAWAEELDRLMGLVGPRFGRVEVRRRAMAYVRGLLAPVERKNGWQLAEAAGDPTPDGMQDFLGFCQGSRQRTCLAGRGTAGRHRDQRGWGPGWTACAAAPRR